MRHIITPDQMRKIEQTEFAHGIPSIEVMERAAHHIAKTAMKTAQGRRVLFACGTGNNGGDGLAAARLYYRMGGFSDVCVIGERGHMTPDAQENLSQWLEIGPVREIRDALARGPALLVDALFGTGLTRAPEGEHEAAINRISESRIPVLAVDIPSGVDARDGSVPGAAIPATRTVTFHAPKRGHVFFPGRAYVGDIVTADIGLPHESSPGDLALLEETDMDVLLPPRQMDAHKGRFGHLLIVAGSRGMAGAAALCARGALAAGAGLVTAACADQSVLPVVQQLAPEAMCLPLAERDGMIAANAAEKIKTALATRSAVAAGPGLRTGGDCAATVSACIEAQLPAVFDADALNCIAETPCLWKENPNAILTPHPGEAARLLGRPCAHPLDDARFLADKYGSIVLLKGASTVIARPGGEATVNLTGTPAMARGGSGDVLTGIIAALLCQGLHAYDAARLGAYLHGRAGERAQRRHGLGSTSMRMTEYIFAE